ncbi:unnamed protein product [Auanema sp. JU1783]|nr:unnamed protein product [Auanema sp. JU1783]
MEVMKSLFNINIMKTVNKLVALIPDQVIAHEGNNDSKWAVDKIKYLSKILKKKKFLDIFLEALVNQDAESQCLPVTKDKKGDKFSEKVLLQYIRMFRFSWVRSMYELKNARTCSHHADGDIICLNVMHYDTNETAEITLPPVVIDRSKVYNNDRTSYYSNQDDFVTPNVSIQVDEYRDNFLSNMSNENAGFCENSLQYGQNLNHQYTNEQSSTFCNQQNLVHYDPHNNPSQNNNFPYQNTFNNERTAFTNQNYQFMPNNVSQQDAVGQPPETSVDFARYSTQTFPKFNDPQAHTSTYNNMNSTHYDPNYIYNSFNVSQNFMPNGPHTYYQPSNVSQQPYSSSNQDYTYSLPITQNFSEFDENAEARERYLFEKVLEQNKTQTLSIMSEPGRTFIKEIIEYTEPDHWITLVYYERRKQVGDPFHSKSKYILIDGYTHPNCPDRFCLGALENINRDSSVSNTRNYIGNGARIYHMSGEIFIECISSYPIFVQSPNCNQRHGWHTGTVCKVPPKCSLKLFSNLEFAAQLIETINKGFDAVYALSRVCTVRVSFVKGWGEDYKHPTINCTPCWIDIQLNGPLLWVDRVLQSMGSPALRSSSNS